MKKAEKLLGSEIVVRCLEELGVEHVFSFPGGVVIPLFDAFYRMDHTIKPSFPTTWKQAKQSKHRGGLSM